MEVANSIAQPVDRTDRAVSSRRTHEGGDRPDGVLREVGPADGGSGPTQSGNDAGPTDGIGSYRADLPTRPLVKEIRRLLDGQRRSERLICRYLADLSDRIEASQRIALPLGAYADVYHAAQCLFGLGVRSTRERVRVGRALRSLPRLDRAFEVGVIGYGRVREVTRVARPESEALWLELGRTLPMRQLERRVVMAGGRRGERKKDQPAEARWSTPDALRIELVLPADTWALVQRAMEAARHRAEGALTDAEALAAVARDALSDHGEDRDPGDPRRNVVLYECRHCSRTELQTGAGAVELAEGQAAALGCGAPVRDLRTEGRVVQRSGAMPAAIRRAVLLRDRCTCRVPGCDRRRYVDVHHVHSRAEGGEHSRSNCMTLCTTHHRLLHEGRLFVNGDAEGELCFRRSDGERLTSDSVINEDDACEADLRKGDPHEAGAGEVTQVGSQCREDDAGGQAEGLIPVATRLAAEGAGGEAGQVASVIPVGTQHGDDDSGVGAGGVTQVGTQHSDDTGGEAGAATQAGSACGEAVLPVPTGQSSVSAGSDEPADRRAGGGDGGTSEESFEENVARLLRVMGARGGWHPDALHEASGVPIGRVRAGLLVLELKGKIRHEAHGYRATAA